MTRNQVLSVEPPRFEDLGPLIIVGLEESFTADTRAQIPQLWQRLQEIVGSIDGRSDRRFYGVIRNEEGASGFRYLAGVRIADETPVAANLATANLDAGRYVVFAHRQHVSKLFATMCAIYRDWLPHSKVSLADEPCFELYGEDFDPVTGTGTMEIWLPIHDD